MTDSPRCDVCGDPIHWAVLPSRRWVALDVDPTPEGRYVLLADNRRALVVPDGTVTERFRHAEVQARRYSDHHRTCSLRGMLRVTSAPRSGLRRQKSHA